MQHGKRKRKLQELQSLIDSQIAATDPQHDAGKDGRSTRKRTGQREEDQSSSSAVEEEPRRGADEQEARAEEDSASVQEDTGADATKRMLRRQRLLRESGVLASPSAQGAAASNDGVGGPVNPKP